MKKLFTLKTWHSASRMLAVFAAALFVLSFIGSTASAEVLKTERVNAAEIQGPFTLMLYGCAAGSDVENVAILKKDGETRSFDIAGIPPDGAEVMAGLEGHDALAKAEKFLGCNVDMRQTQVSKIMDSKGAILGYEVKPLYDVGRWGSPDLFTTRYSTKGDEIRASVTPLLNFDKIDNGD